MSAAHADVLDQISSLLEPVHLIEGSGFSSGSARKRFWDGAGFYSSWLARDCGGDGGRLIID